MRAIAICAVLAACGEPAPGPSAPPPARVPAPPAAPDAPDASARPPGPRLGDGAAPIAYDLTLELDPERATFAGHVAITIAVATPGTTRLWLHAAALELTRASVTIGDRREPVTLLAGDPAQQIRGFALPHPIGAGTITLAIDYTGQVSDLTRRSGKDEEGLFRERAGGRWYLYSQAESVFARKIVPCFDEPRWKPAWRVTEIVPRGQVGLANAPVAAERDLPDGRRELRFAEIARLPSYLLAVAVGPFDVVDAGKLGRGHVATRIIVAGGDGVHTGLARRALPRIIDALETYLDQPLPVPKLDVVAVPQFFGAMENTGLITYERGVLVGGRELTFITAHELAHQWFGNAVTPVWWEHLWLSEAFASWLGDRIARALGEAPDAMTAYRARSDALAADAQPGARPLRHPIASAAEVEPMFDTLAYEKGGAVLAMFARLIGDDAMAAAVRGYLAAHAGTSVGSQAFLDALAAATRPEIATALASSLDHAGTPVVELALRCGAAPAILASVRDGMTLPVCVRVAGAPASASQRTSPAAQATRSRASRAPRAADAPPAAIETCFLAGTHTEHALPAAAGCPAWVVGNAGGEGYYRTLWPAGEPAPPFAQLSPGERLARGDDLALAVGHGDLPVAGGLAALRALAATHDVDGALAALAIARAIDPLIDDALRPAWLAWLADALADRLTPAALCGAKAARDDELRDQLTDLVRGGLAPARLAAIVHAPDCSADARLDLGWRLDAARAADDLFARTIAAAIAPAADAGPGAARGDVLEALAAFPARFAPRVVDAVLDPRLVPAEVWPALRAMLGRRDARAAAWHAIHGRITALRGALSAQLAGLIAATAGLCTGAARAEVAADFAGDRARDPAAGAALDHALATIDRCIARRAAAGDLRAALAASAQAASTPRP